MHWQSRRKTLLEVCGDVSDEDVIKSNGKLAKLPAILGKRKLEDHKKVIVEQRKEINKELERIPIRIDEVSAGLPDISAIENPNAIDKDLEKLAKAKAEKEGELASLLSGGNQGEIKQKIAGLEAELLTIETAYKREHAKKVGEIEDKIKGCQDTIRDVQYKISTKKTALESGHKGVEVIEKSIVELRDKWHEVNNQKLELCVDESCPICGQDLPTDKVQEAKDKAIADFNSGKAKRLADINDAGKANKVELEKITAKITDLENEIAELESSLELHAEDNAKLNGDLAKTKANFEDYKEQTDYKKLLAEKDKLQKVLAGDREGIEPEKERIEAEIETIKKVEADLLEAKANLALHKQGEKRINELEAQQGVLAEEFEKLEEELYLIDLFIRTKVTLLTERINSKFKFARFKLFEEQINGGISEVCETTYNGVPYSSGLNNAARINVGLDIINTLSEHYNFAPPVFIDNAEAVTELIPVEGQLISLIVSGKDKTLRIEGQGQEQATLFEEAI